jgi:hypothetical protein
MGVDLDASPYFFKDAASGQSFAEAFDRLACVLRGDAGRTFTGLTNGAQASFTCPATLQAQAWFDNQLPGLGTNFVTTNFGSLLQTNQVGNLFLQMGAIRQTSLGLPAYNNLQLLAILMATHGGRSNYHAMFATVRNRLWHGLQFDLNYTLARSVDTIGDVQNNLAVISTPFDPDVDWAPAQSDRKHVFNAIFTYDLPFGKGKRWANGSGWQDRVAGGWYASGIYRAFSSLPYFVRDDFNAQTQTQVFGGSIANVPVQGAIPIGDPFALNAGVYRGVTGSGGIATSGNSATGGTGLNLFANPQAAFTSFRRTLISLDQRQGRANNFRGPGFWNLDFRLGKQTRITERVNLELSADFFNVFNHVNFGAPTLSLANPANFGVINGTANSARSVQLGMRLNF